MSKPLKEYKNIEDQMIAMLNKGQFQKAEKAYSSYKVNMQQKKVVHAIFTLIWLF